jgi:hypothetical protein
MTFFRLLPRPALVFAASFALALPPGAALARTQTFQASCLHNDPTFTSVLTRDWAQSYANIARYEGYQWGGGCWNSNDVDEGWGDPPETYSGGEGGDCSGLVFKTWRESEDTWRDGRYYWYALTNVHGPYDAAAFRAGYGAPNHVVAKSTASVMDAFASGSHIGLIFFRGTSGGDQIIEAKCEVCGTNIWYRTYRSDSAYGGVGRWGWTG